MNEDTIFKIGQTLGPYRIVRCIGRGGMGEVYEVEHEGLGVRYALKAFSYQGGRSVEMLRAKFMEEGQVLARLKHPNLVRVFDLTVDGATGTAYYVMDFIRYKDGNAYTLADVDRTSADEDQLYIWFRDVCNALDYIHSKGVVHRDVKLDNILLNIDKHAMLSDFGVAHIFGDGMVKSAAGADATGAFERTGERAILGTNHYRAPEVASGGEATPAADTYALGVAMFRMLTGVWYEHGRDARALLSGCAHKYRWADVLPQLLATDPRKRMQILAQAVIALLPNDGQVRAEANTSARHRTTTWILAATASVALVAACGLCVGLMAWKERAVAARNDLAGVRAEVERLRLEIKEMRRQAVETPQPKSQTENPAATLDAGQKTDEAAKRTTEAADTDKAAPVPIKEETVGAGSVAKTEDGKAESMIQGKTTAQIATYRWKDGSGEPLAVDFRVGERNVARLLPLKAGESTFWISKLPISTGMWREVKGGFDGLDAVENVLPEGCRLCVMADKAETEAFCRAMTERFRDSLPDGCEVRLATEEEMRVALAEDETTRLCEATGRSVDDCVGATGAVARARFRRVRSECRLEQFGDWTENGELAGKQVAVAGLSMPRASGVVGLCRDEEKAALRHLVVGRKLRQH